MLASRLALCTSDIINLTLTGIRIALHLFNKRPTENLSYRIQRKLAMLLWIIFKMRERLGEVTLFLSRSNHRLSGFPQTPFILLGIQTAINKSKVHVGKRHHGIHSKRHSLASELLKKGNHYL